MCWVCTLHSTACVTLQVDSVIHLLAHLDLGPLFLPSRVTEMPPSFGCLPHTVTPARLAKNHLYWKLNVYSTPN